MSAVYAVTSGKGGVGKSTCSLGLGIAFAKLGKTVLLVDMDEGLRCLDAMLGIDDSIVFDLGDVLAGKDISDTVYPAPKFSGLYLVPAPINLGTVTPEALADFALKASALYDIVIFDFPAGIDFSLYKSLPSDTLFLTVALPDPVSIRDASIVSDKLEKMGLASRLILNCFDFVLTKRKVYKSIDDIIDSAGLRLLGIIPRTEELQLLSVKHALKPKGKPMAAFLRIARRLSGENILLPKLKKI